MGHFFEEIDRNVRSVIPKPKRPMAPFRWYGGKGNLSRWVVKFIPRGEAYVEPFSGGASVFWTLSEPYQVEVLNDINPDIANLFMVIKDPNTFEEFLHKVTWTLYSFDEFGLALELRDDCPDPVTCAWAFFVRQNQGFGGEAKNLGSWGRSFTQRRGMAEPTSRWRSRIRLLEYWHERLANVHLSNRDAIDVIREWDSENTVFYLDPPYVEDTRKRGSAYTHEMSNKDHIALVETILEAKGKIVLSGYQTPLYAPLEEGGWRLICKETAAHSAGRVRGSKVRGSGSAMEHAKRTECLWISPNVKYGGELW